MDPVQHDPRTKQQIKNALYDYLYAPVQKQFKSRLDTLAVRNTLVGGYAHKSFIYKGTVYNCDLSALPRKMNRLMPQFIPLMDDYLQDLKALNDQELPFVLGFINQVLNSSEGMSDYLRLFPEAVHHPLVQLIESCPCKKVYLTEEKILQMRTKNQSSIQLMKQRMVANLLI